MVVSALSIAGCSQNEVTEMRQDTNPVLGFNVYTGVPTRGTDVSTTTMQGTCDATHFGGFGIMGYYTGSKAWDTAKGDVAPTFMYNQKVTWDATLNSGTGEWTYSPKNTGQTIQTIKSLSLPMPPMRKPAIMEAG